MSEVNLDQAVECLKVEKNGSSYPWMDDVVKEVIEDVDNFDNPVEFDALKILVVNENFKKKQNSLSVVQCFKTFFGCLEKLKNNVVSLTEEQEAVVELISKDLAGSFQRFSASEFCYKERLILGDLCCEKGDWSEAYQHYCDVLFCSCLERNKHLFIKTTVNQIKCLLHLEEFHRASQYVVRTQLFKEGVDKFSQTLAEVFDRNDLNENIVKQIVSLRKVIFDKYLDYMDDKGGASEEEVDLDRKNATILVNPSGEKGFIDGKFHLQDLQSALNFAKNGGTIFLENGNYKTEKHFDIKQLSPDPAKIITIIGASNNDCSIHGTIKIWAKLGVKFKRIKLEVGEDAESSDALYVLGGKAKFEDCLIEVPVNTGIYVIGQQDIQTQLELTFCIVDGLEACQRAFAFQGENVEICLNDCMFSDMFSVMTVQSNEDIRKNVAVNVNNCIFNDVQDGLKVLLNKASDVECHVRGCQINLVLYDQDLSSSGFEISSGNFFARNNFIFMNHVDGKGFHVMNTKECVVSQNLIGSTADIDRKLAMGVGILLENVSNISLSKATISGFLFGIRMADCEVVDVDRSWVDQCSVGVYVDKSKSDKTKRLNIKNCSFKMMYYGVMCQSHQVKIVVKTTKFWDVPKAFLLTQEAAESLVEEDCEYLNTRDYTCDQGFDVLEEEMNLYLATQQNLPHRVFYERGDLRRIDKAHKKVSPNVSE